MKITAVRTTELPAAGSGVSAAGSAGSAGHCRVELLSEAGLSGIAYAPGGTAARITALAERAWVGADPRAAMGLWERAGAVLPDGGDPATAAARAALDIAAWDLKARFNGEPLWKTLGGARPRAPVHLGWAATGFELAAAREWAAVMARDHGVHSACLPLSADPETNDRTVRSLREVLGAERPGAMLMVDCDGSLPPSDVIRLVRRLERDFDLTCVRSPVPPQDVSGAGRVSDRIAAAVAMGRGFGRPAEFLPLFQRYAANIIELDVAALGISGVIQVADAAFGLELPVLLTGYPGHLPVQLFSALPSPMSVELRREDFAAGAVDGAVTFASGRAVAGEAPGNGLAVEPLREGLARPASHNGTVPQPEQA